jgi:hypothetical protein
MKYCEYVPRRLGYIQHVFMFSACPHFRLSFLEEFLVAHKLQFLPGKVHAQLIHDSCLACSRRTKNNKEVHTYLIGRLCLVGKRDITSGRKPRSCLGRVFNSKLGCIAALHGMHAATSKDENSAQGSSCQLKFVHCLAN